MNDEQLRAELAAVYASRSWRLTAPLRALSAALGALRRPRRLAGSLVRLASRIGPLRRAGGYVLRAFPQLRRRIVQVVQAPAAVQVNALPAALSAARPRAQLDFAAIEQQAVSAPARRVLRELLRARADMPRT